MKAYGMRGTGLDLAPLDQAYFRRVDAYVAYNGSHILVEDDLNGLLRVKDFAGVLALLDAKIDRHGCSRLNLIRAETLHQLGRPDEAHAECQRIAKVHDADPDVWALLGWLEMAAGRTSVALSLFKRALRVDPGHVMSLVNSAYLSRSQACHAHDGPSEVLGRRVCIATSIPPKHTGTTRACVSTWLSAGFEVLSVNPAEELPLLESRFPEVRFVAAPRDGREHFGKPLVYIEDMLKALQETGADVLGIVNADIAFCRGGDFLGFVIRQAEGGMLFGPRVDIARPDAQTAGMYHCGFDYFFFDREAVPDLSDSGFCIGVPWWDIFFPYAFLLQGLPVRMNLSPVAYHLAHDVHWSVRDFNRMGLRFAQMTSGLFGVQDPAAVMAKCTASTLNTFIHSQARSACEVLFKRCASLYYDDSLFAEIMAPVDACRHLDYMRTLLWLKSRQPSPYERVMGGRA
ncbi:Tetratricopeptide repeat containing protein [Desulfocurvibacter africanus PCS]|uniref:Tetratricopeptide repeat containing protein n=1 Tax=Desulfocurvibacter africanus PCS TaxID=1262666 RepID=M5PUY9_DESAF|nr:Tetratricopeptide repeat containing protein [Desulfocurvibacter africanus PCS]